MISILYSGEIIWIFINIFSSSKLYVMWMWCSSLYLSFFKFIGCDNQILHYCFYRIFNTEPSLTISLCIPQPSLLFLFHFLQLKITVWFGFIRCVQFCAVAPVCLSRPWCSVKHQIKTTSQPQDHEWISMKNITHYVIVLYNQLIKTLQTYNQYNKLR